MSTRLRLASLVALALPFTLPLSACSVIVDGALHDGTPSSPCDGLDDGTPCERAGITAPLVCQGGVCANSRCGDGLFDMRTEECDDGNPVDGDGCETDCTETAGCLSADECPAPDFACFEAFCADGTCSVGPSPDTTPCTSDDGSSGVCQAGSCVAATCGDGALDDGELCDDGNDVFGDGCFGCVPECLDNSYCSQDPCFGIQECHLSMADNGGQLGSCAEVTTPVDCGDPLCSYCDSSTASCVPSPSADMDGDTFATAACGGTDCDDTNADIYPGRIEECDPGMLDVNCDPSDEPTSNTWYADCDGDTFAAADAPTVTACDPPPPMAGCAGWTAIAPTSASSTDCHDGNNTVRPNQTGFFVTGYTTPSGTTSFDYNCNGSNNPEYADAADPTTVACGGGALGCDSRPPPPVFPQRVACGGSSTLYSCTTVTLLCRRTASARPVVKRCR